MGRVRQEQSRLCSDDPFHRAASCVIVSPVRSVSLPVARIRQLVHAATELQLMHPVAILLPTFYIPTFVEWLALALWDYDWDSPSRSLGGLLPSDESRSMMVNEAQKCAAVLIKSAVQNTIPALRLFRSFPFLSTLEPVFSPSLLPVGRAEPTLLRICDDTDRRSSDSHDGLVFPAALALHYTDHPCPV